MMARKLARIVAKVDYRYRRWLDPSQHDLRRDGVITMGKGSYGDPTVYYHGGDTARVVIGCYCSIAAGASFIPGGNHRIDWVSTYPFRVRYGLPGALEDGHPTTKGDIIVGNDVWIGNDAAVLSGVTVGDGGVIAAKALVTKDVPPYAIVGGNPARVIAYRFTDEQRAALLEIRWWDWPENIVLERVAALNGGDVEAFIERYRPQRSSVDAIRSDG
jgi:acetyltransferase-like isoleucine patch superfamily enzyme